MNTVNALANFVAGNEVLAYILMFLGIVIEGEVVVLFSGILAHLGGLSIITSFFVGVLGIASKSYLGYYVGAYLERKYPHNRFFKYMESKIFYFLPNFKEKPFWSIFFSKFIYGINHLAIILAGYLKINFKTYFKAEFSSSMIWLMEFLALGYFFSYAAIGYSKDIRKFSIIILLLIVSFILFEKFITFLYEVFRAKKKE
jgi:membrane protein DedA with SNARE-associated domain